MTTPTTGEYETASAAAYNLTDANGNSNSSFTPPTGFTVLSVDKTHLQDGFSAVAMRDDNGNIILAFEGTILAPTTAYGAGAAAADAQIMAGGTANALTDAKNFAQQIENEYGGQIYVSGHSLGGTEAEAAAQQLSSDSALGGGATFGATGLPGTTSSGGPTTLTDYVDYGDPVGNYSSDASSPLNSIAPSDQYHYGTVSYEGSSSDASILQNLASNQQTAAAIALSGGGDASDVYMMRVQDDFAGGIQQYHNLNNYATDLGITPATISTPFVTDDLSQYIADYGVPLGSTNAQQETVESNGSVVTPDLTASFNSSTDQITIDQTAAMTGSWGTIASGGVSTITLNPTTGLATNETYTSPDGSVYSATINSTNEQFSALEVNESNGSSYQVSYTYNSGGSVSEVADGFTGSNLSGTQDFTQNTSISSGDAVTASITGSADDTSLSNASISLAAGASGTVAGNADSIAAAAGSAVTVSGISDSVSLTGTGDSVNASSTTISFAANSTGTITGNSDTISGTGGGQTITISGTGDVESISNATITLAAGASCTVSGANDTIVLGANDTVTITGSSDTASITGNSSTVTESGTSDSATASGASDSINLTGTGDTGTLTGSGTGNGILESGTNDTGYLQGSSENASLSGTGTGDSCISTGSSNGINLQGTSETGTLEGSGGAVTAYSTGSNDTENLQGTGETGTLQTSGTLNVSGSSDAGYLQTASDSGSLTGNSDSIYDTGSGSNAIANGSSDSLYLQGTGETGTLSGTGTSDGIQVTGASSAAVLQGTHESATLSGTSDSSTVTGASDSITLSGTSETGALQATGDTVSDTGTSDGIYLQGYQETASLTGASDSATVTGNNDVANLQANIDNASLSGSADTADLYGTTETVTSSTTGETVNIMATPSNSWDTADVSHDTVNSAIQDKFNVDGSNNAVNASYDLIDFSGTYNVVNASYSVISDLNTTGDSLDGYNDEYDGVNESGLYNGPDPIVLNLTGQQVQTVGLSNSNTYFDMQNDGQRILTGWVTAGEGLLVYDPNNTNTVTDDANLVSSFSQLQGLDSNHDGVLNAQDTGWSQLKVWVDQAGEGNFDSSSLYTLAQLGISSINLSATASSPAAASTNPNNNTIVSTSTFTLANGTTDNMAAVIFADAPNIGTGSNASSGQLTASQFNQLVSASAAYNPTPSSAATAPLVANDNSSQNLQLAASH